MVNSLYNNIEKMKVLNDLVYFRNSYPKFMMGCQRSRKNVYDLTFGNTTDKDINLIRKFMVLLNNDQFLKVTQLLDITAIDKIDEQQRFQLCYTLLNPIGFSRFIVRISLFQLSLVSSVHSIYASANWLERECWDMMGIIFLNHTDLRRILTNYGFEGHPLRKDYPAVGYSQVRYDELTKSVIEEPIVLTQEFRYFDFLSPWERNFTK
jgi:NADH:ubiquinone oxidoreductase subunit C